MTFVKGAWPFPLPAEFARLLWNILKILLSVCFLLEFSVCMVIRSFILLRSFIRPHSNSSVSFVTTVFLDASTCYDAESHPKKTFSRIALNGT